MRRFAKECFRFRLVRFFQRSVGLTDSIGLRSRQPFSNIRPDDKLGNEVIVDLTKTSSEPKSMVSANMRNPETLRPLPRSIFGMTNRLNVSKDTFSDAAVHFLPSDVLEKPRCSHLLGSADLQKNDNYRHKEPPP